jgi:signal transduction histidine kinase
MQPIVESALNRLQRAIDEREAEIMMPKAWPQALGHGPWIEEVWANYISNAIIYGGTPPRIELGADLLPGGQIRFWVRDNGDGLPPELQPHIFEGPGNYKSTGAPATPPGHGLGPSIAKRIVNKLGGEVAVQSSGVAGEGSTFSFTLPAALLTHPVTQP